MLLTTAEMSLSAKPDRVIMFIPGLLSRRARNVATLAAGEARRKMPKSTGYSASRIEPIYGDDYFGIYWADSYVWFQDHGIGPFTMWNLAGKTIPMWIKDPTGTERAKHPKAKTRVTMSGVTEVLIFRKAAQQGQRITKTKRNPVTGQPMIVSDKPASYPGAPGRIGVREASGNLTTQGRVAGAIARGNGGVRWRHPGIAPRAFLNNAMTMAAQWSGILPIRVYICDERWRNFVHGAQQVSR